MMKGTRRRFFAALVGIPTAAVVGNSIPTAEHDVYLGNLDRLIKMDRANGFSIWQGGSFKKYVPNEGV